MAKKEIEQELEGWKNLYQIECQAHQKTKKELEESNKYIANIVNVNNCLKEEVNCYERYFVNRAKIVHCKDCTYNKSNGCPMLFNHDPNFWCAKGKLKGDETNG